MANTQDLSSNQSGNLPLLPRSAWKSQITHLKIVLQVKQSLDRSEKLYAAEVKPIQK
ncbi:hypothetical protein [Nostoc sp. UHCC 0870]|uniref:hypothetical protein n=1 Tax=Nostoc sp. UHCC 0870 TaxID=2914041 RepID=UPI001EDCD7B4|nr:hypothetical protein [Nostoc sp. UHCC 0870]UKO97449.1 hypothetical protein L6494_23200 [Nostoc sp. UHCC 0870]